MPEGDIGTLNRHCRAMITAFATADNADQPTADPVFRSLLDEVASFPEPSEVIAFLAAMAAIACDKLAELERSAGHDVLTLEDRGYSILNELPPGGQRALARKCLDLVEDLYADVPNEAAYARLLGALTSGYGASAVVSLVWLNLMFMLTAREIDPSLTLETVLADWALTDEAVLLRWPDDA